MGSQSACVRAWRVECVWLLVGGWWEKVYSQMVVVVVNNVDFGFGFGVVGQVRNRHRTEHTHTGKHTERNTHRENIHN